YWLCRVIGLGRGVSVAGGVIGMTAGSLVARISSGFNLAQSFQHAWMAPTLASFVVALRTGRPGPVAVSAFSYAMLFHAGNVYLWLLLSAVMLLFLAGYAVDWRLDAGGRAVTVRWRSAMAGALVFGLGALLDAPQGLPMVDMRAFADKPIDVTFRGTQPVIPTLLSFVIADKRFWERELLGASPLGWGVHYAYVGASVFAFLPLLVPALGHYRRRDLYLLLIGAALTVAWAAARYTFMYAVWQAWDLMRQLRYWSTGTHVTTILIVPLLLSGAEYARYRLWAARDWLDGVGPSVIPVRLLGLRVRGYRARRVRIGVLRTALWLALAWMVIRAAQDPWVTNRPEWNTPPFPIGAQQVFGWLRQHDPGVYYVHNHENFFRSFANTSQVEFEVPILNSVWLFTPRLQPTAGAPEGGLFHAGAKYVVAPRGAQPLPNTQVIRELDFGVVYTAPPGLPFAFVADPQRLPYGRAASASALASGQVVEVPVRFDGPNRIIATVPPTAPAAYTQLVVMQTYSSGWHVAGPGGNAWVGPAGGFIGVPGAAPGEYRLSFLPRSFVVGSTLGAAGLVSLVALFALELVWARRQP
ncbi:MAG TPA: hypothetical protein VFX49_16270, partial [Chloroflexota bacterium]|nr:hypothetical protein [Chloroflexota bacterium]